MALNRLEPNDSGRISKPRIDRILSMSWQVKGRLIRVGKFVSEGPGFTIHPN